MGSFFFGCMDKTRQNLDIDELKTWLTVIILRREIRF